MSLVSIVKINPANDEKIKEGIKKSLNMIPFSFKNEYKSILIKPNLCYYWDYTTGKTTNPNFVSSVIDAIRDLTKSDPEIFIVESDASAMKCEHAFRILGYEKLAKEKKVSLLNLSKEKYTEVDVNISEKIFKLNIPKIFSKSNILINIPKIKYQAGPQITCALKNIFGCNAYPRKYIYHKYLDEIILELNKLIKSDLTIVDGIFVEGLMIKKMGLIISSEDPVTIDSISSKILNLDAKKIKYLNLASRDGLGNLEYVVIGDELQHIINQFPNKKLKHKITDYVIKLYLQYMR